MEQSKTTTEMPAVDLFPKVASEKDTENKTKPDGDLTPNVKINKGVILVPSSSDDPGDPLNWPMGQKVAIVAALGLAVFSGFVAPLAGQLNLTAQSALYKTTTVHMSWQNSAASAGLATGGFFFAPVSHKLGLWAALMIGEFQFNAFMVSRFFSGFSGGVTGALGPRILVDLFFLHQRGRAFTAFHWALDFGSVAGPTLSAIISSSRSWTLEFWWTVGLLGFTTIIIFIFLHETSWQRGHNAINPPYTPGFLSNRIATVFPGTKVTPSSTLCDTGRIAAIPFLIGASPVTLILSVFTLISFGFYIAMNALTPVYLQKPVKLGGYGFTVLENAYFSFVHWIGVAIAFIYGNFVSDRLPLAICARNGGIWKPDWSWDIWSGFGAPHALDRDLLFSSLDRPHEDKAWNYLRPPPHLAPFILMKPIDNNICECVVLDGHKEKMMTNSNDPPNSYYTKDLFIAHTIIPNAWKFVGRLDDRVTLTNREKILPLPIEGRIQQDSLVKEAVIFGIDRPVPGLLLFRAKSAAGLSNSEFLDQVWLAIEDANSRAESFSRISRNMIAVISEEIDCPSTDKSSIKRAQVYREFASIIDDVYIRLENSAEGTLKLNIEELEAWVILTFQTVGITLEDRKKNFFAARVDSLKAIEMRGLIVKYIELGGNVQNCSSSIVYDCGNAENLAKSLYAIRTGMIIKSSNQASIDIMSALVEKYSVFDKHSSIQTSIQTQAAQSYIVILTGATGSLGSHFLAHIVAQPHVSKVYCLIRTSPGQPALARLEEALHKHGIHIFSSKIVALSANLSDRNLNHNLATLELLKNITTHIIHCAWTVNFPLPVQNFEPQIAGLYNLIALSLAVKTTGPTKDFFCSSIGVALGTPHTNELTIVPEALIVDLSYTAGTRYARSKLIAEHIIEAAVKEAGAHATVFRIG